MHRSYLDKYSTSEEEIEGDSHLENNLCRNYAVLELNYMMMPAGM
jgi:hypothetical protein